MCWITLDASISEPDSSAIFCVTLFEVMSVALPSPVAVVSSLMAASVLLSVCPIEAIFEAICSMEAEDLATLAVCISMLLFNCLIVRTISSMVAAVSVTLAACVSACCLTPSMFTLIWFTALAVSVIFEASSFPISSIVCEFVPTFCIDEPIFEIVWLKYFDISVISSLPRTGRRTVKSPSPCAIFLRATTAEFSAFVIWNTNTKEIIKKIINSVKPMTNIDCNIR